MGTRQYVGARYVPAFADPIQWDKQRIYEPLTMVTYLNNTYTSKKPVPQGVEINNEEYWALTGNYNAQVEQYRQEVESLKENVDTLSAEYNAIKYNSIKINGAIGDGKLHPLSEKYSNLSEAQKDYPFVTTLDQSIDWASIQKSVNIWNQIYIPEGRYKIDEKIVFPNSESRAWYITGEGGRNSVFDITSKRGFEYIREPEANKGCNIIFSNVAFVGNTSVTGIYFHGVIEDNTRYEDNWLRVYNSFFYNLNRGVDLYCCGQIFIQNCYAQGTKTMAYLGRAASFFTMENQMCLDCGSMIYADDGLHDGISNGITLINCNTVLQSGTGIRINGWEAVHIIRCSCDLGANNSENHIFLYNVQNFNITDCWVSGITPDDNANGIRLWNCHSGEVTDCHIYNVKAGIRIDGKTSIPNSIKIAGCDFASNTLNDIIIVDAVGITIYGNTFKTVIDVTGTNAPIYANVPGNNYIVITANIFANAEFEFTGPTTAYTAGNIFGLTV